MVVAVEMVVAVVLARLRMVAVALHMMGAVVVEMVVAVVLARLRMVVVALQVGLDMLQRIYNKKLGRSFCD